MLRPALFAIAILLGAGVVGTPSAAAQEADPPWSVDEQLLADALVCPATFAHPDREPVLLVHGTGATGQEHFGWNYLLLLPDRGFDACIVTYPDRGFGDLQVSAEYVVHAIQAVHDRTGRMVDVMGHSQGGLHPRWAVKFWPSVRAVVDDAVLVAPPSHGTSFASGSPSSPIDLPAAFFQMAPGSQFVAALNAGDESPGDVSWSVLYSDHDVLVQPAAPVPTAALDWGAEAANVRNVRIQDVCPGRLVDHLTIGTTDRLSQELVLDAFVNPGPVDPSRLGPLNALCVLPDQYLDPAQLAVLLEQMQRSFSGGFPDFHSTDAEPPLKPYAAAALAEEQASGGEGVPDGSGTPPPSDADAGSATRSGAVSAGGAGAALPATGVAIPTALVAAAALAGATLHRIVRAPRDVRASRRDHP